MNSIALDPNNPFATRSTLEYELPPFALIRDEHYLPAFYAGMQEQLNEVATIIANPDITFENTIVALEVSGGILSRVKAVFDNKAGSDTNPTIQAIKSEISPKLAAHSDEIRLNPKLWQRIKWLQENSSQLGLATEDAWILQRYYRDFEFAGANLTEAQKAEVKNINEKLSELSSEFTEKVLADTNDSAIVVDAVTELEGLSDLEIASAKLAAQARGLDGKWLIKAVNFTGNPVLARLKNRTLREKIMQASLVRCARGNDHDTRAIIVEMTGLRARKAAIFGATSYAEYVMRERTAKSPFNVHAMLKKIAPAAVAMARKEGAALQSAIDTQGETFELASWDWDLYTEEIRASQFEVDSAALKAYFELEKVLWDGVFFAATKLYGFTFKERPDLVTYHPEARAFEVFNEDGSKLGLFIGDFYTRDSKRGGAWMNSFVKQNYLLGQYPVVINNLNIPKPPQGEPTLVSFDFLTTLFHEFGHALHGLFSNVKYPRVAATGVERDFVEFPSQVNEMWIFWPEVIDNFAVHYQTGEKLPKEIIDRINSSSTFNQGHDTTAYLQASVLDLALHEIPDEYVIEDVLEFEHNALAAYGFDYAPVPTRYRSTYFSHIFTNDYSAGYYGYIWSEVLDADTVDWFHENGGLTRANGDHFRSQLLSRGGSLDSMQMYRNFRGRDAQIDPLLKRRGMA